MSRRGSRKSSFWSAVVSAATFGLLCGGLLGYQLGQEGIAPVIPSVESQPQETLPAESFGPYRAEILEVQPEGHVRARIHTAPGSIREETLRLSRVELLEIGPHCATRRSGAKLQGQKLSALLRSNPVVLRNIHQSETQELVADVEIQLKQPRSGRRSKQRAMACTSLGLEEKPSERVADQYPGPYRARVTDTATDGDTVPVELQTWWGTYEQTKVRIRHVNTPEKRGKCQQERALAQKATQEVQSLLNAAKNQVLVRNLESDKYGDRSLGELEAGGVNVGKQLVEKGLAEADYEGGKRRNWCRP